MAQVSRVHSTPPINTSATNQLQRLKAAGLRLQRVSNNRYRIIWRRHQLTIDDLTLLEAAIFCERAILDRPLTSQERADELLMQYRRAREDRA